MEELINKLSKFKAADDSAKEMEETIKEAIEQLQEKDKIIDIMGEQLAGLTIFSNDIESPLMLGAKSEVIEYFTKKAREV